MAKRVANKSRSVKQGRPAETGSRASSITSRLPRLSLGGRGNNLQNGLKSVIAAPATLYIAGGIGAIVLARFAYRYYNSHPEVSTFLSDKIDLVESKLRDYRSSSVSSVDSGAELSEDSTY